MVRKSNDWWCLYKVCKTLRLRGAIQLVVVYSTRLTQIWRKLGSRTVLGGVMDRPYSDSVMGLGAACV